MRRRAALGFAVFLAATQLASAQDIVFLRDGSRKSGKLRSCFDDRCDLSGKKYGVADIDWISLGSKTSPASADARGPSHTDTIVLRDGTPRQERMTSLNLGEVTTNAETYDRKEVAIIDFADPGADVVANELPPAPQSPTGGEARAPNAPKQIGRPLHDPPKVEPPPPAPPPPPPRGDPPPLTEPKKPEKRRTLWTGKIQGRLFKQHGESWQDREVEIDVRLREDHTDDAAPQVAVIGTTFDPTGSVIKNTLRCGGGGVSCFGEGTITHPGQPGGGSVMWTKVGDVSAAGFVGYDFPRGKTAYAIGIGTGPWTYPVEWSSGGQTTTTNEGFVSVVIGGIPGITPDPSPRFVEGGVMTGSYTGSMRDGIQVSARWSICREGVECPPLPNPSGDARGEPPPEDPCGRGGQQQAQAEACGLELAAKVKALEPLFAEYAGIMRVVNDYRDEFETMQKWCLAYDVVHDILETIITGGTGRAADAAKALLYLRDLIAKIEDGSITKEFLPEAVQKALEIYEETEEVWAELTSDDLSRLQRDFAECNGKAPLQTYIDAEKFVNALVASRQFWQSRIAPALNDVRSTGLKCASQNHTAWRACVSGAECRGETPNCGPEPSLDFDAAPLASPPSF